MIKSQIFEVDLHGIEPERRDEVRRRLKAIAEFESSPSRKKAEQFAAHLGLGVAQFYNLAKAWRTLQDPAAIAGGSRPRNRKTNIEASQAKILDDLMRSQPDAMPEQLIQSAERQASTGGIAMPSSDKMKRYIHANRARILPAQLAKLGDWIVDHTVLEIPIMNETTTAQRPLATVVIDSQSNSIISLDISLGLPSAAKIAGALSSAVGSRGGGIDRLPHVTVGLPVVHDNHWADLRMGIETEIGPVLEYTPGAYEHGRCVEALFGLRHEGIRLRPRLVLASPVRRKYPVNGSLKPMNLTEAEKFVRARFGVAEKLNPVPSLI